MALHIAPGRRLRWSPRWPGEDASVLFDSASGDFWVLDGPTRELLAQIEAVPGLTVDAVLARGGWDAHGLKEALDSLVATKLLAPC